MGDDVGTFAVEPLSLSGVSRRHRTLTGSAGLILAASLALPAVDLPRLWVPSAFGLVFALLSLVRDERWIIIGSHALRVLAWLAIVGGVATLAGSLMVGTVEVALGGVLLGTIGWSGTSEVRMASTAVLVGAIGAAWFALWSLTPFAQPGAYVGLASSAALVAGGLWWLVELAWQPDGRLSPARLARA